MKKTISILSIFTAIFMSHLGLAIASTVIQVDSVPDNTPNLVTHAPLLIQVEGYKFEIDQEQIKTRLVVDYRVDCTNDGDVVSPASTLAEIPGLIYDSSSKSIVFRSARADTKCASVEEKQGLFGKYLKIKKTGLCRVISKHVKHKNDGGWSTGSYTTLDVYFEVQ